MSFVCKAYHHFSTCLCQINLGRKVFGCGGSSYPVGEALNVFNVKLQSKNSLNTPENLI